MSNFSRGIAVDFTGPKPSLNWNKQSNDVDIQNILVNIATAKNSDPTSPTRGTDLLKRFVETGYVSSGFAQHRANFAAMDTKTFYNATKGDSAKSLNSIIMEVSPVSISSLKVGLKLGFSNTPAVNIEATL